MFVELTISNKPNLIAGTAYKQPSMQRYKFNNYFLENILNNIKTEKKSSILTGDFNLNLIKYFKTTGSNQFLEIILSHSFMPQIILSYRVTGRTAMLIDNILVNSYEKKCNRIELTFPLLCL